MEKKKTRTLRGIPMKTATYILLSVWALAVLFPFYWMVLTAIKTYGAYSSEVVPQFITLNPTLQNFKDAFTMVPLGDYFLNTVIFSLATTALMLLVIVPAAFAFSRMQFRGKELVFTLVLALMMILCLLTS